MLHIQLNGQEKKGGIDKPPSYQAFSIVDFYKRFYKAPKKLDTLVKPESAILHRIWRVIPMNDKINTMALGGSQRPTFSFPLLDIMKFGIMSGKITAFPTANFNKPLQPKMSKEEVQRKLIIQDTVTDTYFDSEGNSKEEVNIVRREVNSSDLSGFLVTEDWYVDQHWGVLERRIVAICPIFHYKNEDRIFFWLYYNECRDLFASFEAYNLMDHEVRISYDEVFLNHWFNSVVTKYSNVFNRKIQDYSKDLDVKTNREDMKEGPFREERDAFGN